LPEGYVARAVVLLYHRITASGQDPWALSVSPDHFLEHMAVVRQRRPNRLASIANAVRDGAVPYGIAVTFDDGYANNLSEALPVLERYDVPATFFVPSAAVDEASEPWWDELDHLLLEPGTLPSTIAIRVGDATFTYDLGEDRDYPVECAQPWRAWRAWESVPPTARHALYVRLWETCYQLPHDERLNVMTQVRAWSSLGRGARSSHRTLTASELCRLAASPLADIGSHTRTHPALASLTADAQADEIEGARTDLEAIIGRQVSAFAYPFGKRDDYTAETVGLVRRAGYRCACSNFPGTAADAASAFELPRLFVRDWDGDEFERQLAALDR
jgi:peptidoglycan/xylan/chitin deacetylase (PgdA/CDA1 family)